MKYTETYYVQIEDITQTTVFTRCHICEELWERMFSLIRTTHATIELTIKLQHADE